MIYGKPQKYHVKIEDALYTQVHVFTGKTIEELHAWWILYFGGDKELFGRAIRCGAWRLYQGSKRLTIAPCKRLMLAE